MRICPQCASVHAPRGVTCVRDGTDLVDSDQDPLIGQPLDRYLVEEKLGEGGMGCVYRARHTVLDREYAIKVLFADFATDQRFLARFRREAQSMSRVRHENIVTVEDFGTSPEGQTFLAMELVRGRTLERIIEEEAPLPPVRAARLVRQMAAGLGAAHAGGFVHRDVKPSNVMVTREGTRERVKILDFGAVNLSSLPTNERLTHVGHIIGTPTYMAPEQSQDPNVGPTADLYALGVVLYEMLAGQPPFDGVGRAEVLVKHITLPAPELPPRAGLERVVARLLRKLPSERPQSADELVRLIEALHLEDPENEETAVTPLELRAVDLSSPPTPPTRADDRPPVEDLSALYEQLSARPASAAEVDDVLGQDTFRPLDSGLEWADWEEANTGYRALDADTDDEGLPSGAPLIAEDLVIEAPSMNPGDAPTRPQAVMATEIVRDRVTSVGLGVEATDPVEMYRTTPALLAPTHDSDDGGPTQVDFDIEPFDGVHAPVQLDVTPAEAPPRPLLDPASESPSQRPWIDTEVSDLSSDTSATVLEGEEKNPSGTVALPPRDSELPIGSEAVTPGAAPYAPNFHSDTVAPPELEDDEIPTSESPPPFPATLPTNLPALGYSPTAPSAPVAKRRPAVLYYVAIAGLSLLIFVLGWILWSGQSAVDLGQGSVEMESSES